MKTKIAVLERPRAPLVVDETDIPPPGPGQVVVRLFSSGVCHSQLHQIHGAATPVPAVLGHEATGVVEAAGKGVTHVREGDHVIVTWLPRAAKPGDQRPPHVAIPWRGGQARGLVFTWAERTLAPQEYVVKIPKDAPTDVTCIIGCAVMTGCGAVYNTTKVQRSESVAVFGVGGVGLCIITAAAIVGASPIIAVDLSEEKLAFARRFGATHVVNAAKTDAVKEVHRLTGSGADYAFDAIGVPKTMYQVLQAARLGGGGLRSGGAAVLVGVPEGDALIPMRDMLMGERRYMASMGGSGRPEQDFPRYLSWYLEGRLKLNEMVTRRYRLEQINEAVRDLEHGRIAGRAILEF
jgi:Zn-dependent alcohol dehydrogenase